MIKQELFFVDVVIVFHSRKCVKGGPHLFPEWEPTPPWNKENRDPEIGRELNFYNRTNVVNNLVHNGCHKMTNQLNILITGATSGFGRQTAQQLASDGHQVFATARGVKGKIAEAAKSVEQWAHERKLKIKILELDVSDDQSVNKAISLILKNAGHLDVVINNAAIVGLSLIEAYSMDQTQAMFITKGLMKGNIHQEGV